jgi:hypothetical protein
MAQLDMYSSLSSSRNYICGKAFSAIFSENILIKYLISKKIKSLNIKAIFARLLHNIYLDKVPRLAIQKPNLIRVISIGNPDKGKQLLKNKKDFNNNKFQFLKIDVDSAVNEKS